MSTLEALYFPGTELYSGSQFPIFLFLDKVHLLQPVEEEHAAGDTADIFITRGLCQAHTPVVLGENRDRFLRLISDIRERKDDYAAQLSGLTIASLSQKKSSIDDSQFGIISSLLGSQGVKAQPEQEDDVELWQARLVLKIGEILDREDEEIAMQMAVLEDDEQGLFKALQGEFDDDEESLFDELKQLKENISKPTASTIANRLSAWSKLYRAGEIPSRYIWLTHSEETGDTMLERYQEQTNIAPVKLVQFTLPANIGWARTEASDAATAFRSQYPELIQKINEALHKKDSTSLQELSVEWSQALEAHFPASQTGRTELEFYTIADRPCDELIGSEKKDSGMLLGIVRWKE
ncbi:hypothetical protein [Desulfosediminicola ganghwensis]|uniref:hypothetical protein n=1 Tax=Desulfosediminicola ganghwensis TaxID=2569540 RepID=UPI0010ACBDF1|nr:hypothetical protein [Desulfosediminicola ganghwensis]